MVGWCNTNGFVVGVSGERVKNYAAMGKGKVGPGLCNGSWHNNCTIYMYILAAVSNRTFCAETWLKNVRSLTPVPKYMYVFSSLYLPRAWKCLAKNSFLSFLLIVSLWKTPGLGPEFGFRFLATIRS